MPLHKDLTGSDLHDPKGFSTASNDTRLIKNASGTLEWSDNNSVPSGASRYGEIITADGSGSSAYGQLVWKDLIGAINTATSGVGVPDYATFMTGVSGYQFTSGEAINLNFHIPHDYAVGTDMYLHVHWGHNQASLAGTETISWDFAMSYAKRTATAPYATFTDGKGGAAGTTITPSITMGSTVNITNYPQYCHVVEEIQLTAATPVGQQMDSDNIEVDGTIACTLTCTETNWTTGPFLFFVDIHYQADIEGTKNKDPNFYT
jgi:hypothetical protein